MDPIQRFTFTWNREELERQKINEAASEINSLADSAAHLGGQIRRLLAVDQAQSTRIAKLEAVVWALIETLAASGAVPTAELNERISGALAPFAPPEPPVPEGPGGYRDAPRAAPGAPVPTPPRKPPPVVDVACVACGRQVPSSETLITADGALCEACHTERVLAGPG
ncbi:MAG: hypothetical protein HY908_08355 [Myxococcales bacterium]|nr:hypothetical protein [Myxococcales bacterium]